MKTLTLLWLTFSPMLAPSAPANDANDRATRLESPCPPEHRDARLRIGNLLGSPLWPRIQARFDFGTASVEDVRLLSNPDDRETCVRLWEAMEADGTLLAPADKVTFFMSGNRYLVPIARHQPAGVIRLDGRSSLDVYDADFRIIGRFRSIACSQLRCELPPHDH